MYYLALIVGCSLATVGVTAYRNPDTALELWPPFSSEPKVIVIHYQRRKMATAAPRSFAVRIIYLIHVHDTHRNPFNRNW